MLNTLWIQQSSTGENKPHNEVNTRDDLISFHCAKLFFFHVGSPLVK